MPMNMLALVYFALCLQLKANLRQWMRNRYLLRPFEKISYFSLGKIHFITGSVIVRYYCIITPRAHVQQGVM